MKPMKTIQDLIEEAKLRTVWWALCIFTVTYFLSHTSSSMWMNLPISIMLVSALRILSNEVEFSWKVRRKDKAHSYLSHLGRKQLSANDSRLSSAPPPPKWKKKIDSPVVEAAINDFIDKILKDFVVDLWYSAITPDKEAPELIRAVIMDALGEISERVKEVNLVDLLTRDIIDLIGDHLDLFRRNQAAIGADVMMTLSTEERDERLKHHLMASKDLHPALISPESEYKVLQRLVGAILAVVLRPREAQSPLVRTIAREIVTCLVLQPIMNLACPGYVNEVIEYILLAIKEGLKEFGGDLSMGVSTSNGSSLRKECSLNSQNADQMLARTDTSNKAYLDSNLYPEESVHAHPAEWARILEAATQRRTEVLTPENLENMWTKGRHYKKKENKKLQAGVQQTMAKDSLSSSASPDVHFRKEMVPNSNATAAEKEEKAMVGLMPQMIHDRLSNNDTETGRQFAQDGKHSSFKGMHVDEKLDNATYESRGRLRRSNSTSDLNVLPDQRKALTGDSRRPLISEFYSPDFGSRSAYHGVIKGADLVLRNDHPHAFKLKCRVVGAFFEKLGSKSFAVYSIAVTDSENRTWFVKRRYRNFERLHRHLKDIPNYTLHLPPKRIFSSSTEDAFVHQRCIQLDKYLQDLLSIANVAEQHEVWDFLSVSSKNYSFGKSSSVMRTLAVNVDDAVDDIVRQFKGVSDGLMRKVVGSPSLVDEGASSIYSRNLSWNEDEANKLVLRQDTSETTNSFSDNEESHIHEGQDHKAAVSSVKANGWHSDNELNSKHFPRRVVNHDGGSRASSLENKHDVELKSNGGVLSSVTFNQLEDPVGMPPEWTPPNVSVPLLNLVDKVFQLKRRGWLRRQVFWMSKQILHLIMDDAIDDFLLRQIHWLRSEEIIAQGIRWAQDILWPNGTFFTKVGVSQSKVDSDQLNLIPFQIGQFGGGNTSKQSSFEEQLEAARRASDIKKMLLDGAPTPLVSLVGYKQYRRCARDIFFFTQVEPLNILCEQYQFLYISKVVVVTSKLELTVKVSRNLQSTICVKQLAYAILEVVLLSIFPELRDVLLDLHEKMRVPPA
ncbi:hypothetical protein Tsubulata_011077 [Turnera subulata]|uniref:PX domain-containing protein n=1 Tax=Turnera subulata TaxID=218843 RepID=A0A9Q0F9P9_9ROSI|nr:hypothetical protein Tsubulata_011077 [Turnera subulata]